MSGNESERAIRVRKHHRTRNQEFTICGNEQTREAYALAGLYQSTGAAYRIRTCDVLIRSQTLYPAEVTPQRKRYNGMRPRMRQAII